MGGEQSVVTGTTLSPISSEMFLPAAGFREQVKLEISKEVAPVKNRRRHIVKTPFAGIWSLVDPESETAPEPRIGHFYCHWEAANAIIVGFGANSHNEPLEDIWILNINTYEWEPFPISGEAISARVNSRACILGETMYIFGGELGNDVSNDIYAVNLDTKECVSLETEGDIPSARSLPIFAGMENELFVWGGTGTCSSDLYVLDLTTRVWEAIPQDLPSRSGMTYDTVDDCVYAYGGSNTGGIVVLSMSRKVVTIEPTSGPEPPSAITNGGFVHFDNYLMFIGGISQSQWTLIHCFDLTRRRWFIFHVLPDGSTVTVVDGNINDFGLFQLPRTHSMGLIYNRRKREILGVLGAPVKDTAPLFVIRVGEALSCLHLRADMLAWAHVEE